MWLTPGRVSDYSELCSNILHEVGRVEGMIEAVQPSENKL